MYPNFRLAEYTCFLSHLRLHQNSASVASRLWSASRFFGIFPLTWSCLYGRSMMRDWGWHGHSVQCVSQNKKLSYCSYSSQSLSLFVWLSLVFWAADCCSAPPAPHALHPCPSTPRCPAVNRFTFSFSADLSRLWFRERFLPAQPCNLAVFGAITATRCCFVSLSISCPPADHLGAKFERFGVVLWSALDVDRQPSVIRLPGVKDISVASCSSLLS